ncbi:cytochrome P450, partial [Lactarius hengduanensis]
MPTPIQLDVLLPVAAFLLAAFSYTTIRRSDVVHVDVLGTHMVIINSAKAANELFGKRSSIYSDRPSLVALNTILGMDWANRLHPIWCSLAQPPPAGLHAHFHPAAAKMYRPLEQHAVHRLLRNLLQEPESFSQHLRHMAGQVILAIAYGIDVRPQGDPYAPFSGIPSVNLLNIVIHMPHWFPGASFKREGRNRRPHVTAMIDEPYALVQAALVRLPVSVAATLTTQLNDKSTTEDIRLAKILPWKHTVAALQTFFLAMALYPEVQHAAHAEIDADKLPYVSAVLKEVLRWHPVAPLVIGERMVRITPPSILRDRYRPQYLLLFSGRLCIRFQPERWLAPGAPCLPACPGRFMARESVWAAIVGVLAAFEISPVEDDPPKELFASGIVAYPEPFKCLVHPRSEAFAAP